MILVLVLFVLSFAVVGFFLAGFVARRLPDAMPDLAAYAVTALVLWLPFLVGDMGWGDRLGVLVLIALSLALGAFERTRRKMALRDTPPGRAAA